jgi:hypothetical protein
MELASASTDSFWEGEFQMRKLCLLAAASGLLFGLSSAAVAAPVIVTYGITPGTGTVSWDPSGSGGGAGGGNAGGQMVIVYTSGSTAIGGTLGTLASMQAIQLTFVTPATFVLTIPGMGVANGIPGVRTAGGVGNFAGATYVPAGHFTPQQPKITGTNVISFAPTLGTVTVLLNGIGKQTLAGAIIAPWTISGVIGSEVSRVLVPEPGSGVLLFGSLAVLAYGVRRLRR